MTSKNVETLRAAHECWNRREFEGVIRNVTDTITYTDHARNLNINTKSHFKDWVTAWAQAFPNGKITHPEYIDAGDTVIAQFTVEGTNDGPLAGLPPTKRHAKLAFCEICRFDANGRMTRGGCYYDQYSLLTQLGHVEPLATAA